MKIIISLKDGSTFELSSQRIRSIIVEENIIKIRYKKEFIIFENNLLESFTIHQLNKFLDNPGQISNANNLIIILTNILYNSN